MGFSIGPITTFLGLGDAGSTSVPQSDSTLNSKVASKKLRNSNSNTGKTAAHSMGADPGRASGNRSQIENKGAQKP